MSNDDWCYQKVLIEQLHNREFLGNRNGGLQVKALEHLRVLQTMEYKD